MPFIIGFFRRISLICETFKHIVKSNSLVTHEIGYLKAGWCNTLCTNRIISWFLNFYKKAPRANSMWNPAVDEKRIPDFNLKPIKAV